LLNAFLDQADDDVVTDQTTCVHHLLGGEPHFGASLDGGTQHVTRRDLRNAKLLAQKGRLRALAGAGRAQQNQSHVYPWCPMSLQPE